MTSAVIGCLVAVAFFAVVDSRALSSLEINANQQNPAQAAQQVSVQSQSDEVKQDEASKGITLLSNYFQDSQSISVPVNQLILFLFLLFRTARCLLPRLWTFRIPLAIWKLSLRLPPLPLPISTPPCTRPCACSSTPSFTSSSAPGPRYCSLSIPLQLPIPLHYPYGYNYWNYNCGYPGCTTHVEPKENKPAEESKEGNEDKEDKKSTVSN